MRKTLISLAFLFASMTANAVDFSLSIGSPNLRIGVNVQEYPNLIPIRGYPVYYSPDIDSNYFFYDGLYWVYQDDSWYASSWYNGPWSYVDPYAVPVYVLRVPVRYYRRPPVYFRGWAVEAPPRWDDHWGHEWHDRRHDWDRWDHRNAPRPLPLPVYQRQYVGDRYPDADRQRDLQQRNYHYQPRNPIVAAHYKNERQQNDQWHAQHPQLKNESRDAYDRRQQQEREEQQQKARREEDQKQQERQRNEQQQRERQQQEQQQQLHREEEQRQQAQRQLQEQQQQARRIEDQRKQSRLQQEQRQQQAQQQENQQAKQREEQQRQQTQQQSQEQQRQSQEQQRQAQEQQRQAQERQRRGEQQQRQQQQNQERQADQRRQGDDRRERPRENQRDKEKSDKDRDNEK